MGNRNAAEKMNQLMASYVPEFSFDEKSDEPGSVLSVLCRDMIEGSEQRFDKVVSKHKIQYLNLLDELKEEPVAASKGYAQFQPVLSYETENVFVPKHTQVMAQKGNVGDIIFETTHDMSATNAVPVLAVNTDKETDTIICHDFSEGITAFKAFSNEGENQAEHKLYLCFDSLFDYVEQVDFDLYIEARNKDNKEIQEETIREMTREGVTWYMQGADGEPVYFDKVEPGERKIHFEKKDYRMEKSTNMQREGYYIVASASGELGEIYIDTIRAGWERSDVIPEQVYVNGMEDSPAVVYPFGRPMGLYNEFSVENREVLSKRGALITLDFDLDYSEYEESLDVPQADIEYKNIMKKPKKSAVVNSSQVLADYVVWEYLSQNGWKRIWQEEYICSMFNGTAKGHMSLSFTAPEDMMPYEEDLTGGRIRARLLRAENIYKVPAVYVCPRISQMKLSYRYEQKQYADYAYTCNSFEDCNVTMDLHEGKTVTPFYCREHERRCLYLGFDASLQGTPASLYFDIDNFSDRPITFTVEYFSDRGFKSIKVTDATSGFLGSGNLLLMIPGDMKKTKMYGKEAYFIRFVGFNREYPDFALPLIRGIYMNMAKIENINVMEEVFYLDSYENAVDLSLAAQNLLKLSVWGKEKDTDFVLWSPGDSRGEIEHTYQADLGQGTLHISRQTMLNTSWDEEGPQIKVSYLTYMGSVANLAAGEINSLRNSIRFISAVTNPFPTYGGYDGYTEETSEKLITSMLRTRNRAVSSNDFFDIIAQTTFGVRKVKCLSGVDLFGNPAPDVITVAVLIDEYEKGVHIFSEMKEQIRKKLEESSAILPMGKKLVLTQPHFVKLSVRIWIERETMEGAYDIQNQAMTIIHDFIDPLKGGALGGGREIGEFPRSSQIVAALRTGIEDCIISKIVMTAFIDGRDVPVKEEFYQQYDSPFIMAVNGEHIVYIELI